ncbi:hypothetical protein FGRMN_6306 [Fusarium graminum]|nr:hypothetical protein FGRMN_6306 [Fusarium graminum]
MSDNSRSGRYLYPYDTSLYVPVNRLSRTPSGRVYDPAKGIARRTANDSTPRKPRQSEQAKSQGSKEKKEIKSRQSQSQNQYIGNPRVNMRWRENVKRTLGQQYEGLWNSPEDMVKDARKNLEEEGGSVILDRRWTSVEFERAGRLKAWDVPLDVIEACVGWPCVAFTEEETKRINWFARDEMDYLKDT